jgi:hypothetical protein
VWSNDEYNILDETKLQELQLMHTKHKDLERLDRHLGLEIGTTYKVFEQFDTTAIKLLNNKLLLHRIVFAENTKLIKGHAAWKELCEDVGLGSEWHMTGTQEPPNVAVLDL